MSTPAQRTPEELRNLYHQLRTPLNGIFGMAGILLDSPLRPDQAEMVMLIKSSAEDLLGLLGGKPDPSVPPPPAADGAGKKPGLPVLHLLLAEDDPANQMVDLTLLSRMGHIVEAVENGKVALERLADGDYDAVILDCQMPEMDGFETARRIRTGSVPRLNPQVPIIALTAYTSKVERDRCLAAGMNDCLSKPLNSAQMAAALARCGLDVAPAPAASATLEPDLVLDLTLMKTMRDTPGNQGKTLLDDFVALFLRDEPRRVAQLRKLVDQRSPVELARMAHTVGGSCAMLGAKQMQLAALGLERAAAAHEWSEVDAALREVDAAWAALGSALKSEGFLLP